MFNTKNLKEFFSNLAHLSDVDHISYKELVNKILNYFFFLLIIIFSILLLINVLIIVYYSFNYNLTYQNYNPITFNNKYYFVDFLENNIKSVYYIHKILKYLFVYIIIYTITHIMLFLNSFLYDYFKEFKFIIIILLIGFYLNFVYIFINFLIFIDLDLLFYNLYIYIDFITKIRSIFGDHFLCSTYYYYNKSYIYLHKYPFGYNNHKLYIKTRRRNTFFYSYFMP